MKKVVFHALLTIVLFVIVYYFYLRYQPSHVYYSIGWIIVVLILVFLGNQAISIQFNRWLPWLAYGKKRLFLHLFLGIIYSLITINVAYLFFKFTLTDESPTIQQLVVMNVYGTVIFIPIFTIYFSTYFLEHWKKSELETEKLKQETVKSQLDNLKNHLDPHFMFNNLNILSSLIDEDKEKSKQFLDKFSDVYRALLKSKNEDLISLFDEIELVNSYIYLLKERFEENIKFDLQIEEEAKLKMIPPLTLQMLIENAVKHNKFKASRPLQITIKTVGDSLTVCNSLNRREEPNEEHLMGSGIHNICNRYAYFTSQSVEINEVDGKFCVIVPLLEIHTI